MTLKMGSAKTMTVIQQGSCGQPLALFSFLSPLTHLVTPPNLLTLRMLCAKDPPPPPHVEHRAAHPCMSHHLLDTSIGMTNRNLQPNVSSTGFWYYLQMAKLASLTDLLIPAQDNAYVSVVHVKNLGHSLDSSLSLTSPSPSVFC